MTGRLEGWEERWELCPSDADAKLSGGQGHVVQVRHRVTGQLGALKRPRPHLLKRRESRGRMSQEVTALKVLRGWAGTPDVLESNAAEVWETLGVSMYMISEWIDGETLNAYAADNPCLLDEALAIVRDLAATVNSGHRNQLLHRDIKPRNIILPADGRSKAVLVDYGLSWSVSEGERADLTLPNEDVGNRFLRLPEQTAGRNARSPVSDVTQLVGVLLFLVSGREPKQLRNELGKQPQDELSTFFPDAILQDMRLGALNRVFRRGLQYEMRDRFQSIDELIAALDDLEIPDDTRPAFQEALRVHRELVGADPDLLRKEVADRMQQAAMKFFVPYSNLMAEARITPHSSGPRRAGAESRETVTVKVDFGLNQWGKNSAPAEDTVLEVKAVACEGQYTLTYAWPKRAPETYYKGPINDPESLDEAFARLSSLLGAEHVRLLNDALLKSRR